MKLFGRRDPLDRVMFKWDDGTKFTVRELVKSTAIFGQTGSGKSSGSNLLLARKILAMGNSGGLILASKPEDRDDFWIPLFKEAGRSDDLVIFAPDQPNRCNFLECMKNLGADALEFVQFITVTGEFLDQDAHKGERFWAQGTRWQLYHSIVPLLLAGEELTMPNIGRFNSTAAMSDEHLASDQFKAGYFKQVMDKAVAATKDTTQSGDFEQSKEYWDDNRYMHAETRSNINAGTTNILRCYNSGVARETVSTTTTWKPEDAYRGKWALWDYPLDKHGDTGRVLLHGVKYLMQKTLLRRHAKPGDAVVIIHVDEADGGTNSFDSEFLSKCRSRLAGMIYLTQSLHGYTVAMGEDRAKALLTNFGHIIAHTIGDPETAKYLSDMLGQREADKINITPRNDGEEAGATIHKHWEPILQPNAFMSGLRSGGKCNGFCVDGIVLRSGERFRSGYNYIYQVFKQR